MTESQNPLYWLGLDLGGTKMVAAAFDSAFKSLGRKRRKTKGHEGAKAGVNRIVQTIQQALEDANISSKQLAGIGAGCPGTVDLDRGIILNAANLGWKDVPIKEKLEKEFGCPVVILNDVDAGVYGEYRFGAARSTRCVVGVFPGTGIGGGCVYEGQILRGKTSSCMEIGHIQVVSNGRICGCGRQGCLETEASRLAISAAAAKAAFRGEAPKLLEEAGTDLSHIRSGALAHSIKAGDVVVKQIVLKAAGHIGTAVGNVVNLLAPDIVVLGGGLVEAIPDLLVTAVAETAKQTVMPSFVNSFEVVPAKLGDDASVMGAAAWAAKIISDPEKAAEK